ncbi:MAG: zf-HC2 domain-containing protein [Kiritimatiellae bacterium]|nr:zf-HC2 domain-containing protein [Kiritimatiellia bacterium]
MSTHPAHPFDYAALDAYLNGDLPFLKRLACARHLKRCPRCRAVLERVKSDNQLWADISAAETTPPDTNPTNHEC